MQAAKHFDQVIGFDIHIVQPPATAPPAPVPHPYWGMIMSVADYLPFIGQTLKINGLCAAQPMTNIMDMPPHFPLPPGGSFIKMPVSRGEVLLGSATVGRQSLAGSLLQLAGVPQTVLTTHPLSRTMSVTLGCADVGVPPSTNPGKKEGLSGTLGSPNGMVIAAPIGQPVNVGGFPGPAPLDAWAIRFAIMKLMSKFGPKVANFMHGRADWLRNALSRSRFAFLRNLADNENFWRRVGATICHWLGHPVDITTGKVFTDSEDFNISGPIPLVWERIWHSSSGYNGPVGHGWHHSYDMALIPKTVEGEKVLKFRMEDGRAAYFPQLETGESYFDRMSRLDLSRDEAGYRVRTSGKLSYRFHEKMKGEWRLASIENDAGFNIRFEYDGGDVLAKITDSANRIFRVKTDAFARIIAIHAPHPDRAQDTFPIIQYRYDEAGDLVEVLDALGHPFRYQFQNHLLVQETNRNGLNFYFEYEGQGVEAKCVHTYGDGDILNYKLTYEEGKTIAEKIVKTPGKPTESFFTTYYHNGGLVTREIDPLGNEKSYAYNEFFDLIGETDPIGHTTKHDYDDRGNKVATLYPDGSKLKLKYSEGGLLLETTDQAGGKWKYEYDDRNKIINRTDSMGYRTEYLYNEKGLLTKIINPASGKTLFGYDQWFNIEQITTPDNATNRWKYDLLGREKEYIDSKGNICRWKYDLNGQALRVDEPDGNKRIFRYDPEGNLITARDKYYDLEFEYQGMWKLKARIQNGTRVDFKYNSEEQLVAVVNEHGSVYQFDLDANGNVEVESGFDEVKRYYQRDPAGRVSLVMRASGIESRYKYDKMGRVVEILHSSGEISHFVYREDGELIQARNNISSVVLKKDLLGRIVREEQNGISVNSIFNNLGIRTHLDSSLGLDLSIDRNQMGDVMGMLAQNDSAIWDIQFKRDIRGLEVERILPGGIKSKWERDNIGRPVKHEIIGGGGKKDRSRTYVWDIGNRLKQITDFGKDVTHFQHDSYGNLALVRHPDGAVEYRMPDAIGNLFKKPDQKSRKYGKAGQLLEAEGTRYEYDQEGYLIKKTTPEGAAWYYEWNAAGMLSKVIRPDKEEVVFSYDPFGRRLSKTYRGQITRWVWDGDVPIHEWKEPIPVNERNQSTQFTEKPAIDPKNEIIEINESWSSDAAGYKEDTLIIIKEKRTGASALEPEYQEQPRIPIPDPTILITWLFEPDTSAPVAKLTNDNQYSIQTDHLGTPVSMYDESGERVWAADINTYGKLINLKGNIDACPFRFQGQYYDPETGLAYNRFRYFDPQEGRYISQDPIGFLSGEANFYAYAEDPTIGVDILGLAVYHRKNGQFGKKRGRPRKPNTTHGNSVHSTKPRQHYVIVDDQGRVYHGVGDTGGNRALQSKARLEAENPGRTFQIQNQTNHSNSLNALKAEARGIRDSGGAGAQNTGNYNISNSPGAPYI